MADRFEVIVVGGGPVGLALALDLGRRGVSCALVERRTQPHRIPKGQLLTHRTVEHFYFWGIVDELRAARTMPRDFPIGEITTYESLNGQYWHAPAGRELVRPYFFLDNDRLPQYQTEDVLRKKLASFANVCTLLGWTATSFEQDERHVRVHLAGENGGAGQILEADYLVGCDGGHSIVREQSSIARSGTDFDQLMMLAVFRSPELNEFLKRFPQRSTYRVAHPDLKGFWQFFGRVDGGESWFFHAPVPLGTTRDSCDVKSYLRKAIGFDIACEFEHIGFWDLRVSVADKYRDGRVFIAGDAAHSHPPYGGYGLNNGLEDAINLGWKLDANLKGWGGEKLLDSYTQERQPVFKEIGDFFITARIEEEARFLEQCNPDRDGEEFTRAWIAQAETLGALVKQYEPNYEGSGVILGTQGGHSGARGQNVFKAQAGHHLAPQLLSSGQNVFAELGTGFSLLAFDAADSIVQDFARCAQSLGIPLKIIRDTFEDGRRAYEARLILVRPDQFIAWTADEPPPANETDSLLRAVAGR